MLSFHGKQEIKDKYLNRVIKHRELDNIIQGIGWENGKGCAVGCTLENYNHSRYPMELGLPEWLARLEDKIFEELPKEKAMLWPERFLDAIPVGVCVEKVKHIISIKRMERLLEIQNKLLEKHNEQYIVDTINSIKLVINCHKLELNEQYCDWSAWAAAESAAESARSLSWSARSARSAWAAARSSAELADSAWAAAESAESAADSSWAAAQSSARSARSAADSLAAAWAAQSAADSSWAAAWEVEANTLIECLKNCE
jgi:hypothetical protein